ncbi:MAG TPA: SH3 domain-containing protein [Caulobacteraceae bacterium]|nr:SH3 domain-containing protein [Caulobacteraceae bacterium]
MTAACVLLALGAATASRAARPEDKPTPSGLPVPRWVSLKFGEVNARSGPGDDHRLVWVYRARNLPVQVIAETREWRKICDPEGGTAWVHRRVTSGERTALRLDRRELPLRAAPRPEAKVRARLVGMGVAGLDKCERGWCRLSAAKVKGWAPEDALWGTAEKAQCR